MWSRAELKDRAKKILKLSYWKAFWVSIVLMIAGGTDGGNSFNFNFKNGFNSGRGSYTGNSGVSQSFDTVDPGIALGVLGFVAIVLISIFIVAAGLRIFLGYPLQIGARRYFVRSTEEDFDYSNLTYFFKEGRYLACIKAMFLKGVYLVLWTLLLIIPGIIKGYAYRMVPYILADNPHIGSNRAIELSNAMTDGEKFDMWVLDLSFIGWYLLGTLALFIGVIFVMPYENATKAELYTVLRQKALDNGSCTHAELNMKAPIEEW